MKIGISWIRSVKHLLVILLAITLFTTSALPIKAETQEEPSEPETSSDTIVSSDGVLNADYETTDTDYNTFIEDNNTIADENNSNNQNQETEVQDNNVDEQLTAEDNIDISEGTLLSDEQNLSNSSEDEEETNNSNYSVSLYERKSTPQSLMLSLADAIAFSNTYENENKPLEINNDQTEITLRNADGLILLSNVNPSEYNTKTIKLINNTGVYLLSEGRLLYGNGNNLIFLGLGNEQNPFCGNIYFAESSDKPFQTNVPIFNYLSMDAAFPETITFQLDKDYSTNSSLLADNIVDSIVDSTTGTVSKHIIKITVPTSTSNPNEKISACIGGVVNTLCLNASADIEVRLENNANKNFSALTIQGEGSRGLFCNNLKSGSSLTANLQNVANVSLTVNGKGDAGGYVGIMEGSNVLYASGSLKANISSENGNAGGLVGSAKNSTINISSLSITYSNISSGNSKAAGGLIGYAENAVITKATEENSDFLSLSDVVVTAKGANAPSGGLVGLCKIAGGLVDLDFYNFNNITVSSSGGFGGGLFGSLNNSGHFTITGTETLSSKGDNVYSFGGLIGLYSASKLSDTLTICGSSSHGSSSAITIDSAINNGNNGYGGVIGKIMDTCYVIMENVTVQVSGKCGYFGGLIARVGENVRENEYSPAIIDAGGITINGSVNSSNHTGGLIGDLVNGVLRLKDNTTINISISADYNKGNIVGFNTNGLVYAFESWTGTDTTSISNIGNWGDIIRLSKNFGAGDTLFKFDNNTHLITVMNGDPESIGTAEALAGYALAFDYGDKLKDVLKFTVSVNAGQAQSVKLTNNIDLTNTGILGIGRDYESGTPFQGIFDGDGHTITLDIGNSSNIHANGFAHCRQGLFPTINGETEIKKLTVNGNVKISSMLSGNKSFDVSGITGVQSGRVTYDHVISSATISVTKLNNNSNNGTVRQAGIVSSCNNGSTIFFKNSSWTSNITSERTNSNDCMGGFIAYTPGNVVIEVVDCSLSGSITNIATISRVGGLAAEINRYESNDTLYTSTISISNLTVSESISSESINSNEEIDVSGGLLGCHWFNTNVNFGVKTVDESRIYTDGVKIEGATLNANTAKFGGLVYQATGHWDSTRPNSIKFTGTADKKTTISGTYGDYRGLLVGDGLNDNKKEAIYLELGTWGKEGSSYYIDKDNMVLTMSNSGKFDELVGRTISNIYGNDNGIVSLWTGNNLPTDTIDQDVCNTYTSQLGINCNNGNNRYYYNLSHTAVDSGNLDEEQEVVTWSASQFAAYNIRDYLCTNATGPAVLSNVINLSNYSYYPVTSLNDVSVQCSKLSFNYENIENTERSYNGGAGNKKPSDSNSQHYLMQHGLLYNAGGNFIVGTDNSNISISGNVGKLSNASGVLILGGVSGTQNSQNNKVSVYLYNITLDGLFISEVNNQTIYAPLLINSVGVNGFTDLKVNNISTSSKYSNDKFADKFAATSLIGRIGSENAQYITLEFTDVALDSRVNPEENTIANNNGSVEVQYNTKKTIFSKALFLESFQYASDSSGFYNFNSYDSKVTYGSEISNTTSGRNMGEQYYYYNEEIYVWDGTGTRPETETAISTFYNSDNKYLSYVRQAEDESHNYHELDINLRIAHLDVGCGTYGHPYQITDGKQLIALADFLVNGRANKWVIRIEKDVYDVGLQNAASYHTSSDVWDKHKYYLCDGDKWFEATPLQNGKYSKGTETSEITTEKVRAYLRNAYYEIEQDINISSSTYMGIGGSTTDTAFSGVIVGKNIGTEQNKQYPKVYISSNISNALSYGGLIRYSQGSVVMNLTVSFSGDEKTVRQANITLNNNGVPGVNGNNPFFGGVIGYCMGGDTIIDNVSVEYIANSVKLGDGARFIATGGYVGLVGGAKNSSGYEKTGGGLIFRNMGGHTNNFEYTLPVAREESLVLIPDGSNYRENANLGCTYFFCNPYIGRVLDGYACYDTKTSGTFSTPTLNNTDKNYTIPNLYTDSNALDALDIVKNASDFSVTVNNSQGLWLLSAIINSGASSIDNLGKYTDVDNGVVDAYYYGKPRSSAADYSRIGKSLTETEKALALTDEGLWGGVKSGTDGKDFNRISYLISGFTNKKSDDGIYYASQLTGKRSSDNKNNPVSLSFSTNIDMSNYANGFRGIGASYTVSENLWTDSKISFPKNYRRQLYTNGINTNSTSVITVKLQMNQCEFHPGGQNENYESGFWNQGVGLFTSFSYVGDTKVNNLKIEGLVCLNTFSPNDGKLSKVFKKKYDYCVGGFAGLISNSSGKLSYDNLHLEKLNVYGGTTTGGVFGITCGYEIVFSSFNITDVNVIKTVTNDGSIGGMIGLKRGIVTIGNTQSKSIIKNLKVEMYGSITKTQDCGGLIGCSDGNNLTFQNITATNLTVNGTDTRDVGGLVSGFRQGGILNINNCEFLNLNISYTNTNTNGDNGDEHRNVGGLVGYINQSIGGIENVVIRSCSMTAAKARSLGGLIGYATTAVTFDNCHISGSLFLNGNDKPYLGGIAGRTGNSTIIKNCTEKNLSILSGDNDAGGLIGQMSNGGSKISNIEFSNVIVATGKQEKSVGLLTGHNNGKELYGYNILAKDCKTGINVSENNSVIGTINSAGTYVGLWLGGNSTQNNILVALSTAGSNYPQKDVGNIQSGTVNITYSDYPAITGKDTETGYPHMDIKPVGTISIKESVDDTETFLTGNGVGYLMVQTTSTDENGNQIIISEKGNSIAQTILEEISSVGAYKKYWNLTETSKTYPQFISASSENIGNLDSYVTTYQNEESDNTNVPSEIDFPVLVVNGLANADKEVWNYIAALTNVIDGTKAKEQAFKITSKTYKWTVSEDDPIGFVKQITSSLKVNTADNKTLSIVNNAYDNHQSQFTLIDVEYKDPTNTSNAYHLYVPVLVKKVLYVSFSARPLAGTNYSRTSYAPFPNGEICYATAGFNEPITIYFEYNYQRTANEWNTMLANGDGLQWYYNKTLELAYGGSGNDLPDGTKLTLVDKQTGKYYMYVWDNSIDKVHNFDLSKMRAQDDSAFIPVPIGTLLGLTTSTEGNRVYVQDNLNGTISIGNEKYRPVKEDETGTHSITVNEDLIGTDNYLKTAEGYYLTIQVPKNQNSSPVVNNSLRSNSWNLENKEAGAPLAYINERNLGNGEVVAYVIYDGVQQLETDFIVESSKNGIVDAPTSMEDNDQIVVKLSTKLSLTEAGKTNFINYAPSNLIHQFNLNMKKYVKVDNNNQTINDIVVGAEGATYNYCISIGDNVLYSTADVPISNSEILDSIAIDCLKENYDLVACLKENKNSEITISAEIKLPYPVLGTYFPGRTGDDEISGVSVKADSRVATNVNQLPIASLKAESEEKKRYYTVNPSSANLTFNTYKGPNTEDATRKLGVNPSDAINDLDGLIYANGVYDFSSVDADVLSQASKIKYTLELFVKDPNGNYNGDPLLINKYLSEAKVLEIGDAESEMDFLDRTSVSATYLTFDKEINKTSGNDSINIKFKPLTGNDFEMKGFTYANYKVRLTAIMLDASGNELSGTKATDYIIYTNARVFPQIIK